MHALAFLVSQDRGVAVHRRLEVDPLVEPAWLELPGDAFISNRDVERLVALRAAGKLGVAERRSDSVEVCVVLTPRCHDTILVHGTAWCNARAVSEGPIATATFGLVVTDQSGFDEDFLGNVGIVSVVGAYVFGHRVTNRLAGVV